MLYLKNGLMNWGDILHAESIGKVISDSIGKIISLIVNAGGPLQMYLFCIKKNQLSLKSKGMKRLLF